MLAVIASWQWPLFGDAGIFHYIVFAMQHGAKPYTEIKDFNFPGTYLLDAVSMRLFGGGAMGERVYDLCLCVVAAAGFYWCLGRGTWARSAATVATGLLVLIHLHDGLGQEGQRDFAMAAIALLACGVYLKMRCKPLVRIFVYQVLVGFIFTIKPTLFLLFIVPLLFAPRDDDASALWKKFATSIAGVVIAPAVMAIWLVNEGAFGAFFGMVTTLGAVHGELARRGVGHLLVQGVSPLGALVAVWVVVLAMGRISDQRNVWSHESRFLAVAAGCGFASSWIQGKGLVYQRQPFLALVMLLIFFDLSRASEQPRVRYVVMASYLVLGLWLCPKMLRQVERYQAAAPFETALEDSLEGESLRGGVQCLDTYSGCLNALYDMRVQQSTGYLYDCYLYTAESSARDAYRREFLAALQRTQPAVLVMSDQDCFHIKAGFGRVKRWPELAALLQQRYALVGTWNSEESYLLWSRGEVQPAFEVWRRR